VNNTVFSRVSRVPDQLPAVELGSRIPDPGTRAGVRVLGSPMCLYACLSVRLSVSDPGSGIRDPGPWTQDPGPPILDPGSGISKLGFRIPGPGSRIRDRESGLRDAVPGTQFVEEESNPMENGVG